MCGIAGFFNYKSNDRHKTLSAMSDSIAHRGPDGAGEYIDDTIGFAHRRLSIIDLKTGEQPMFSGDKRFVTVFNGEIYNYCELRSELKNQRAEFRTNSDTEVIAEGIRKWGIKKTVLKLRGMFAFAVYDFTDKKLYLARDRTGIKPLYYTEKNGVLFFASEQKSLLEVPEISRKINSVAINDVLTLGFPVTPDTCWKDIKMFPPANFAESQQGGILKLERYWQWKFKPENMSLDDALDGAKEVLQSSLKYHLRSDVPLAAFLSGGIDSSLLVTLLSKGGLVNGLKTFNVGFDEFKYDESDDAEHVAKIARTDHTSIRMKGGAGDPDEFEKIVAQYDEPYGDSSCLPTYMISREMRKNVKVVISGDGGDELFGGYSRVLDVQRLQKMRMMPAKTLMKAMARIASPLIGSEFSRRLGVATKMASASDNEMLTLLHTYFSESEKAGIYSQRFTNSTGSLAPTWTRVNKYIPEDVSIANRLMGMELDYMLHADYLRKVDIASSAHGLEVRVPFLDSEVMDFAAKVPLNLKISGNTLKYLLRKLAWQEISDRIANKGKWGFGVPFDSWCGTKMQEYLKELLFSTNANENIWQIFNRRTGEHLWDKFIRPEKTSYLDMSRFQIYQRIFLFASTQIWFNKYHPELERASMETHQLRKTSQDDINTSVSCINHNITKKKKILCAIGQLGNGGSEKQLYLFLKNLDRDNFAPYVVVTSNLYIDKWKKGFEDELKIPVKSLGALPSITKFLSFKCILRKFQPDIIFSWSFYTNPFVMVSGKIPFIGSLRGGLEEQRLGLSSTHLKYALKPKSFIVNSERLLDELSGADVKREQISIIKNIYDPKFSLTKSARNTTIREKYNIPEKAVLIAGGGRNSPSKDFPFWLDSFECAFKENPDLYAILFGHGPEAIIGDELQKRGLDKNIILTGDIPYVLEILNESDVFFLSSLYEGLPNVVLEAIDAGCTILSTDTAGIRDIFQNDEKLLSSIMLKERDPALAGKMLLKLSSSKSSEKEKLDFSDRILSEFNPKKIMPEYLTAIAKAEGNSSKSNKKINLLCVIGQLGNGGTEKQLYMFLKYIDREKYEPVVVVSGNLYIDKWKKGFEDELKIPVKSLGALPAITKCFAFKSIIREFEIDVVFSWSFFTNPFVSFCGKIPFIGSLRGGLDAAKDKLYKIHFKWALKPEKIIVNSSHLKNKMLAEGIEDKKIKLVKNIFKPLEKQFKANKSKIREEICKKYNFPIDSVIVSGGGGTSVSKNFQFWLDTFEKSFKKNNKIRGILFGRGPELTIQSDIIKRGLDDKIILTGEVPEITEIIQSSDIFFLSSVAEGMPNVLLEAIDAGCTPFASDVGGVRDIFGKIPDALQNKILIEIFDVKVASKMLLQLASDDALRENIVRHASNILPEFTPEVIMSQYYNVLSQK